MKTFKIFFFSTLFILMNSMCLYADGKRAARFFPDTKIKASSYNALSVDKEGFLWVGTNNGLIRFDGNNYDIYRHEENNAGSLSDNRVLNLLSDSKGRLWIGTPNGLNLYNPNLDSFEVIDLPSIDINGYIIASTEQKDGTVTFVVSGHGLFIIDDTNDKPAAVRYLSPYPSEATFNSVKAANNRLYIGDANGNVYSVAPNGHISLIFTAPSYIVDITEEKGGSILFATVSDLYRHIPATGNTVKIEMAPDMEISHLSNYTEDCVYIGTNDSGLWQLSHNSEKIEHTDNIRSSFFNIGDSRIGAVYVGEGGNIWIGCNHYGIMMVPGEDMPFHYRRFSDINSRIKGVLETIAGWKDNVIIGFDNGQVAILDYDGNLQKLIEITGGGAITSINVVGDRAYLGVANNGVWEMEFPDGNIKKHLGIDGKYREIVIGPTIGDGTYIAVHGTGLYRHDHNDGGLELVSKTADGEDTINPYINTLCYAGGKIWIGHYNGFDSYDPVSKESKDYSDIISGLTVFTMVPASEEILLMGTSQGLIHFDIRKGSAEKFTTAEGLTDNTVKSIAIDNKGRRWLATMRGISLQHPEDNHIDTYFGGYGLVDNEFNAILSDQSGAKIFVGSSLGVSAFEADSIPDPGFEKSPAISAVMLNGKRITGTGENGEHTIIIGKEGEPYRLVVPFKDNSVTLRLSMMDFMDPSNLVYMWRLGDKGKWRRLDSGEDLIYFSYLDPGQHRIQIRAEENNRVSPVNEIIITVLPPWYLSVWAKILYCLAILVIALLGYFIFQKKRKEKINDEKIKYFIDVSHDIRSPITLILDPLENLMKGPFEPEVKSKFKLMHRNALRIINLVNQMLDIRKFEKGKMTLSCRKTDLNRFVEELVEMFSSQAKEKGLELRFNNNAVFPDIWLDRTNFDKILVNLISNSLKYTPKGGEVDIEINKVEDPELGQCAEVRVIDTGIGLDEKTEKFMFERFYRGNELHAHTTEGVGIGLDLCKRLAGLHHGSISGANRKDGIKGSVFSVRIPLDAGRYTTEEKVEKQEEEPTPHRHVVREGVETEEASAGKKRKNSASGHILIVDDDSELREYMAERFSPQFSVAEAENGVEALKSIHKKQPDLIISDIIMPQMDGLSLLKRIKSNTETSHIPVILLSSRNELSDRMSGWDKGADAYVSKPFSIEEMNALVDNMLFNRLRMKGKFSGTQDAGKSIDAPKVKGNDQSLIDRIMKVTREHIDDSDFNVESLASEVGISRAHLHRKMKELMGITPVDFILNVRLRRACELLKNSDIEVTQVAYTLGYGSQSHFSTTFKKFTGYTPTEYRKKYLSGEILPDFGTELEPKEKTS